MSVRAARDSGFKNVAGGLAGMTVATATIFFPRVKAVNPARSDILRAENNWDEGVYLRFVVAELSRVTESPNRMEH